MSVLKPIFVPCNPINCTIYNPKGTKKQKTGNIGTKGDMKTRKWKTKENIPEILAGTF